MEVVSDIDVEGLDALSLDLGLPDLGDEPGSGTPESVCLVVDPDQHIQRLVHTWLVDIQVSHTQLNKFEQALPACTSYKYSLIFMDLDSELELTTVRNGFEAAHNLRLDPSGMNRYTPIIGITNSQERAAEAAKYGMCEILLKPFNREQISNAVKRWSGVKSEMKPQMQDIPMDIPEIDISMLDPPDFIVSGLARPKTARVLVVEDCRLTQHIIQELLKTLTPNVSQAFDGEQALQMCSTNNFDVIFMDITMPKLNGIEATRQIRTNGTRNMYTPIVAFTSTGTIEQYKQFGVDDLLPKPCNTENLVAIFDKWTAHVRQVQDDFGSLPTLPALDTSSASASASLPNPPSQVVEMDFKPQITEAEPANVVLPHSPLSSGERATQAAASPKLKRGSRPWAGHMPVGLGLEMPQLTSYSTAGKGTRKKGSKPRVVHNFKEQQRRSFIAGAAEDLKRLIPNLPAEDKATVFKETVKYVQYLRQAIGPEQLQTLDANFNLDTGSESSFKNLSENMTLAPPK